MQKNITVLATAMLMLCSGCVQSINPLFTDRDLAFDHALIGKWSDAGSPETWEFTSVNSKEYRLVHTDADGKTGTFNGRLATLKGRTFLDLVPAPRKRTATDLYEDHYFETHSFVLIEKRERSVLVSYLEPDWLKDHLAANPSAIRHTVLNGEILLTDSTENLQKFVSEAAEIKGAFSEQTEFRSVRAAK